MSQSPPKLRKLSPRQPFVGLALAAVFGILCADIAPRFSWPFLGAFALFLLLSLVRNESIWTYALVVVAFFLLHGLRTIDTPGLRLAQEVGDQAETVTASGFV